MALQSQEIADRIRELREARGNPPQTVVAATLGVSERTYQTWELGEAKPSYRNLEKIAAYFSVSEDFILTGVETAVQESAVVVTERVEDIRAEFRTHVVEMNLKLDENQKRLDEILAKLAGPEFAHALEAGEGQLARDGERPSEHVRDAAGRRSGETG